ncbi:MAG: AAA family ATPase [Alphaproteobacteria bacterium]|nr:AAA family ATPase [Alphaproteobacteria bacterium]
MVYKRIMLFGLPGSGKTTFATHLSRSLNLPLYHLDKHFFVENWIERDKEDFLNIQRNIVTQDRWIIDGNALASLELRYSRADLVLFFCLPRSICLGRLFKRRFFKDLSIDDRGPGCPERLRFPLVKYMWTFDRRVLPILERLRKTYPRTPFYKIKFPQDLNHIFKL